ncbi:LysR family transcriptional regulator [Shimia sp. SDUM112013]|uniref:LysR family transcriptional regulator n=1 Tax=Shimia sp. SDUM112013 TaxID=3136160 RepID=UPI0032EB880C
MAIKLEMLRCFCEVAKAGNLSDAATALVRTQSAVSMTLKQLEQDFGQPLFEGERKNRLTPLGEQVLALGTKQIKQFDTTIQTLRDAAKAPHGVLRMAAVPSVAALVYPHVADFLNALAPEIRLELRDMDTEQVKEALEQGWADIGIASRHLDISEASATLLFEDRFGLVCAETHAFANRAGAISLADLDPGKFLRNALCDRIETPSFRNRLNDMPLLLHNTHSLLAMVHSGRWVTILPRSVMTFAPAGLRFLQVQDLPDARQVYLFSRRHLQLGDIQDQICARIRAQDWAEDTD